MNDKNLILAVVLSVGVMIGWSFLVEKHVIPGAPAPTTAVATKTSGAGSAPESESGASASAKIAPEAKTSDEPKRRTESAAASSQPIDLRTPQAEIELSAGSGGVSSYRYRGPLGWVELVLVPSPGLFSTDSLGTLVPLSGNSPDKAAFEGSIGKVRVRKEFDFKSDGALSDLRVTFRNESRESVDLPAWSLQLGPGLGTVQSEQKDNPKLWRAIGLFPPPPNRTKDVLDQLKNGERSAPWNWLAVDNRYFLAAALASPKDFDHILMEPAKIADKPAPMLRVVAKPARLAPGEEKVVDVPFYLGPKRFATLEKFGLGLERSVNFGWFDTLGRWTLKLLEWLYARTGNYGWSIILLTLMIQLALFPLTWKSLKSMAKMRKVQPEMAKIQQKFKEDPQRLNQEMMELYRSKGVNPMGGCLPMVAQMPIFVALFNALRNAWELHGQPWIFWVHDLSAHDPYYILPVIMMGVMYVQNQLNPAATADPTQANMMKFMPLIFGFMFANFPAGLVLYWLTNSLLSTVQQLALRKQLAA